jgi:hypothetical protein
MAEGHGQWRIDQMRQSLIGALAKTDSIHAWRGSTGKQSSTG